MFADAIPLSSLDARLRDVLAVLALADEPSWSRTAWKEKASIAGLVDDRGRQLTGELFKSMVGDLTAAGASVMVGNGYALAPEWLAPVLDDAERRGRLRLLAEGLSREKRYGFSSYRERIGVKADLRVALAMGDPTLIKAAHRTFADHQRAYGARAVSITDALGLDIPVEWARRLETWIAVKYLEEACQRAFVEARPLGMGLRHAILATDNRELRARLATVLALEGSVEPARALVRDGTTAWERGAAAFVAFTAGEHTEARALFAAAAVGARKQRVELPSYLAVFDNLLAATSDVGAVVSEVESRLAKATRQLKGHPGARAALEQLARSRGSAQRDPLLLPYRCWSWIDELVQLLVGHWLKAKYGADLRQESYAARARAAGYVWVARELEAIARAPKESALLTALGQREGWELALEALKSALASEVSDRTSAEPARDGEIWWTLMLGAGGVIVEPHLTSPRAPKGKKLSVARLRGDDALPVDAHDRRIADAASAMHERGSAVSPLALLEAVVGHPRVRGVTGEKIEVTLGDARLRVRATPSGAHIRLSPAAFDETGVAASRESPGRIVVVRRTPAVARALTVLGQEGLAIPRRGLGAMSEVLGAIAAELTVDAEASLAKEMASADERIHVQLFRAGLGLRARLRVQPGGPDGASCAGVPPEELVVRSRDGLARVRRDLAAERARAEHVLERCPTLASLPQDGDDRVARELATCLEVLVELAELGGGVVVSWPEGQPLRAPTARGPADVRVRVRGDASWLVIDGELKVDEERVLAMRELLSAASRAVGRFVPIGEDEYLALTDEIRGKLEALARVAELSKDGRVPGALLPAMDGVFEGLDVTFAKEITRRRAAIERANALEVRTPRDLRAELRDYQLEGFAFLARRTEAGLGACLADDMGLGKTVQTIALLLHRAARGPALVVAPTSVCRNWEEELGRFAPSLDVARLAVGDRAATVRAARTGQVVLVSYALLAAERELLASRAWSTVVFDEAHALKNASTHRWAAASALDVEAKVALTGTPVENHSGELHALFDLLAPGMLGSRPAFDRVFGAAVARGERSAVTQLRQLVRPFVLRRTKSQVLSELPPKTEILRVVEPTPEHRAFYEAVRRRAVERLASAKKASGPRAGQARIEVLAEITRLRRAAVDPRLVGGADAPSGSKLDALVELVLELRAEGRRALVFTRSSRAATSPASASRRSRSSAAASTGRCRPTRAPRRWRRSSMVAPTCSSSA